MKKSIFLSAVLLFSVSIANAQTEPETLLKQDIASLNNQEAVLEKQKKEDKEQLQKGDIANLNNQEARIERQKKADKNQLHKLENSAVTYQSKEQFYRDFGDVAVTKSVRRGNLDEFTFPKEGQFVTAIYDLESKLVGTTEKKTFSDIPGKAQIYILDKYPDYKIGEVVFFDDNEQNETDMVMYGQSFDDADNYFVALKKDNKTTILKVNMEGDTEYFKEM